MYIAVICAVFLFLQGGFAEEEPWMGPVEINQCANGAPTPTTAMAQDCDKNAETEEDRKCFVYINEKKKLKVTFSPNIHFQNALAHGHKLTIKIEGSAFDDDYMKLKEIDVCSDTSLALSGKRGKNRCANRKTKRKENIEYTLMGPDPGFDIEDAQIRITLMSVVNGKENIIFCGKFGVDLVEWSEDETEEEDEDDDGGYLFG